MHSLRVLVPLLLRHHVFHVLGHFALLILIIIGIVDSYRWVACYYPVCFDILRNALAKRRYYGDEKGVYFCYYCSWLNACVLPDGHVRIDGGSSANLDAVFNFDGPSFE